MISEKEINEAIRSLNDPIATFHQLTGIYPKKLICDGFSRIYQEQNYDYDTTIDIIGYLENSSYQKKIKSYPHIINL